LNWDLQDFKVFDGLTGAAFGGGWLLGADLQDLQDEGLDGREV